MLDIAGVLETLAESAQTLRIPVRRRRVEIPDHRQLWLLRPRRQRPRNRCAAECRDECAPLYMNCHATLPTRGSVQRRGPYHSRPCCAAGFQSRLCRLGVRPGHCGDVRCTTALPPKTEVDMRSCYVAEVPQPAVSKRSKADNLFDQLVGATGQRKWNGDT